MNSSIRMRPESAKVPFSSAKRNTSLRSQAREDSRLLHTQMGSSKPINSISRINALQLKRLIPQRTDMSPQRLYSQNLALKKKLNEMGDQLRIQKKKGETVERRNAKWKKKLDVEFEKEMYWGPKGEYMVMGVTNQYQKIKKMYDEKCQENRDIKRDSKYIELTEVTAELQAYRSQANRLKQELDKFIDIYNIPYEAVGDEDYRSSRLLAEELKEKISKREQEVEIYREGMKKFDRLIKDRDEKIRFLEKLVIDKDNYSYNLEQTSKRLQHQNQNIKNKNKELKELMEEEKSLIEQKIQQVRQDEERRLESRKRSYESESQIKTQKITKLEAEIVYLSTLLAQWRPTENDPMKNSFSNQMHENKSIIVQRKESNALSVIEGEELKEREHQLSRSFLDSNLLLNSSGVKKEKNTHYSLKRDIVRREEIENICLEMKFRLLNNKIDIATAKAYIRSPEGQEITIKDLHRIFRAEPFCMESEERTDLLARYLIEDSDEKTVYYDMERGKSDVVVRSIFQQIIPKFTILSQEQEDAIKSKVIDMITKYHVTLSQVVSQYSRQMTLNQKKFVEVLDEQELNMGQEYNDYMVSHMLKSSPDITQLSFKSLLSLVAQKEN